MKEKLNEMKRAVDSIKAEKSKLEGKLESIMQRLKDEFKIKSIKEADKLLKELKSKELALMKELEERMENLEKEYDWS